jgi:putative sigma-54 modulation protein
MEILVTSRSGELTDGVKEYAAKKLKKLEKLLPKIDSIHITEAKERAWHILEVNINADGLIIRGQERDTDLRTAIDQVVDKLERQVKKYRQKMNHHSRQSVASALGEELAQEDPEEEVTEGRLIKTKRFLMKPMNPEEAAAEMELLGHDFFLFVNAVTEQVSLIYRRRDGNYGLIEPDY